MAQRNAELNPSGSKKFRSSAAPKGTKLAAGYQDRTKLRDSTDQDDRAKRVQALEEMVKLGQMDEATFLKLRDEIVGGDVENVHLVKGLDFKLLRKIREGSDVTEAGTQGDESGPKNLTDADLEDELGKLEGQAVAPIAKEEKVKIGVMAPPTFRSRDEILKKLRAARNASALEKKTSQPSLGSKFKKVGERRETSRIERDEQGREVLILVDADGNIKRKVKKAIAESDLGSSKSALPAPDKNLAPLGMEVPQLKKMPTPPPVEDLDIFDGVGTDFNPLLDEGASASDDDESVAGSSTVSDDDDDKAVRTQDATAKDTESKTQPEVSDLKPERTRNYFEDEPKAETGAGPPANLLEDPTIQAALKRAANIQAKSADVPQDAEESEKLQKRKRLLENHDRDAEDMDLGFGGSRLADDEDFEDGKRVKLSVWGEEQLGDRDGGKGGKQARKRGSKKRKGDVNNAADVLKVIERRKGNNA